MQSVEYETKTIESIADVNSAVDRLLSENKQVELYDVQDHMNDAIRCNFFNPSIEAALKR